MFGLITEMSQQVCARGTPNSLSPGAPAQTNPRRRETGMPAGPQSGHRDGPAALSQRCWSGRAMLAASFFAFSEAVLQLHLRVERGSERKMQTRSLRC